MSLVEVLVQVAEPSLLGLLPSNSTGTALLTAGLCSSVQSQRDGVCKKAMEVRERESPLKKKPSVAQLLAGGGSGLVGGERHRSCGRFYVDMPLLTVVTLQMPYTLFTPGSRPKLFLHLGIA